MTTTTATTVASSNIWGFDETIVLCLEGEAKQLIRMFEGEAKQLIRMFEGEAKQLIRMSEGELWSLLMIYPSLCLGPEKGRS